jgi:hypothetical protein
MKTEHAPSKTTLWVDGFLEDCVLVENPTLRNKNGVTILEDVNACRPTNCARAQTIQASRFGLAAPNLQERYGSGVG